MENKESPARDVRSTTPAGETGIEDMRADLAHEGKGRVSDATGHQVHGDRHQAPGGSLSDLPDSEDPYGRTETNRSAGEGPSYERSQGTADPNTGGSTDTHNFMTHANSGDETEQEQTMNQVDNPTTHESVDGFSDTEGPTNVDSPDPGTEPKNKPLSPDEFVKAKEEIEKEDDK